jgi:hypothetical protein
MVRKDLVPDIKSCHILIKGYLQNKPKTKDVREQSSILGILNNKFVMESKRGKKDEFWKNRNRRSRMATGDSRKRYL